MLERFFAGIATILVGLNVVAFGVWSNGGAHRGNPVWRALSSFLNFEVFIIKWSLAVGLAYLLYSLLRVAQEPKTVDPPLMKPEVPKPPPVTQQHEFETTPHVKPTESTPLLIPPTPSTEDLKQKAIEQIVRGF